MLPKVKGFRRRFAGLCEQTVAGRLQRDRAIVMWCAARSKNEVVRVLASCGAPVALYATAEDLLTSAQLEHRKFFRDIRRPDGSVLRVPGLPYQLRSAALVSASPPSPGAFRGFRTGVPKKPALPGGRMLEGIRVLDFTWAAAGPYATLLLAFLGAEVIKVETTRRTDPARRGFLDDYGGLNRSPNFNELNLNKRSLQLDLTRTEGRDVVGRLLRVVDVIVDNFRPGVMDRFGLDAATLLTEHPALIVASSSANGSTGPDALAAGYASVFGASGGLSEQTGYADGPPTEVGESTDYRSGNAVGGCNNSRSPPAGPNRRR